MKFGSKAIIASLLAQCATTTNAFVVNQGRHMAGFNTAASPSVFARMTSSSSSSANVSAAEDAVSTDESNEQKKLTPEFEGAMAQVVAALKSAVESPKMLDPLLHFVEEYFSACCEASLAGDESITAESTALNMQSAVQYGLKHGTTDKYTFGVTHTALRGKDPESEDGNTIDFYKFGCDFFRPAMNSEASSVLGLDALKKAEEQLAAGENVVFFANHQSEADPQVMSVMLEKAGMNKMAEDLVYVAGHKVTTDTLAIPFSMGRNLICIHSKKHIDADADSKPIKQRQNLMAMNGMLKLLKKGGTSIWVAPSGGRDRREIGVDRVPLAPFDQKTIDMFRLMGNKSKVPTHYYAVSMISYDLCPPPDFIEAGVGEQRNVRYVPVGIAVSDELENVGGVESRHLFTEHAFEVCEKGYDDLIASLKTEE
jgi:glycerol-3-phosphate O-acyltransferase